MSVAHYVHGFNVTDAGQGSSDRLIPYFERMGFQTREHDYGWFGLLQVRFCNGMVADRVAAAVQPGDIGVGHSNGCAILTRAAAKAPGLRGLVLINPALDTDTVFAPTLEWVHVYHSNGDRAVHVAQFLPFHQWGDMGRDGYLGDDPRVKNYDHSPDGHSEIFTPARLAHWGPRIAVNAASV